MAGIRPNESRRWKAVLNMTLPIVVPNLSSRPFRLMVERTSELPPDVLFRAWTEQFDFHEAVTLEPEESPVVRMALLLVTSLEKAAGLPPRERF